MNDGLLHSSTGFWKNTEKPCYEIRKLDIYYISTRYPNGFTPENLPTILQEKMLRRP